MQLLPPAGSGFEPELLSSPEAVEDLLARGARLRVEAAALVQASAAAIAATAAAARKAASRTPGQQVLDEWDALAPRLKTLCRADGDTLGPGFVPGIEALARQLMELAQRAPDTGLYRLVRQEQAARADYAYTHAIHTALAGALVAWRQSWPQAEVSVLVKAALTMNLSTGELQGRMASEVWPGKGRDDPRIHRHAHVSAKMLLDAGVRDRPWLEAVRDHHERYDGGGYPSAREGLGRTACLLRMVDIFTARLTPRANRPALSPREAWRLLRAESMDDTATRQMAEALLAELGTYPPGELVQLRTGEVGVVVLRRQDADGAPTVAALTDSRGARIARPQRRDTSELRCAIVGATHSQTLLATLDADRVFA